MNIEQIKQRLKETLSEKRYNHSLEVMKRCEELAQIYGVDVEKAKLVGLAHDIAKELSEEQALKIIEENKIELDEIEKHNPGLWHAKIGAVICKNELGFTQDMVQAVENHTTGKVGMDLLSQILFVADGTGLDRDWYDLQYARDLSEKDLPAVIIYIIDLNISQKIRKGQQIHPKSVDVRNDLIARLG